MSLNQDRRREPTSFIGRIFAKFGRPPIRPSNTVPSSLAGGAQPFTRPRPIKTGFTITGKERGRGRRGVPTKFIKSPPIAFVRNRIPDVELTRRTGLTPAPLIRKTEAVSRRSQVLTEPAPVLFGRVRPAVIGERRNLTIRELAVARKASPKAVDPNLVRLRNRRSPRVPPVKKRLIGGGSFGGIRARGVGFTQGGDSLG